MVVEQSQHHGEAVQDITDHYYSMAYNRVTGRKRYVLCNMGRKNHLCLSIVYCTAA